MSTAIRHIVMLQCMPLGQWVSTRAIQIRLSQRGYDVSMRSIQRDLQKLAADFGLQCEGIGPSLVWRRTLDLEQMRGQKAA
jgi:hypothetical protein